MKNTNVKQWLWAMGMSAALATSTLLARANTEGEIKKTSALRTQAEQQNDINSLLGFYAENSICMPEYQTTLQGKAALKTYYSHLCQKAKTLSYTTRPIEYIHMGKTTLETGTFEKEYICTGSDTSVKLKGKYFRVWQTVSHGNIKLTGESFGYYHPLPHPEFFVMEGKYYQPGELELANKNHTSFELKAYNALMEKGVRERNGQLRSQFFTGDALIMPYADTIISGIEHIKPYIVAYSSRGRVTINEVTCYTLHYENFGSYIIEYDMFKVKWTNASGSGRTEGKGIRLWKRQKDGSLRLHREIGTHNHIPPTEG